MKNRSYIDCSIEAALAMKNHGFRVGHCHGTHGFYELDLFEVLQDIFDDIDSRLYILPESLPLLEPMVGDLIKDIDEEYQLVWRDHKGLRIDTSKGTQSPKGCSIIQRNNLPFPTIKYEEAAE